jgi:hypothetical protein
MRRHLVTLHRIHEQTGKRITLALEPEPCCYLETTAEAIDFFERHVFSSRAIARFCDLTGLAPSEAEVFVRRHLGICFDACHAAVEFEEPYVALSALRAAGIRVAKIQVSAGLQVDFRDPAELVPLAPFAEGVYLHQVVERCEGRLTRYTDLPDAIAAAARSPAVPRTWRIHFHVPIFREQLGAFRSTQADLRALLGILQKQSFSQHLEVETYTWDVLPEEHRREGVVAAVAREIRWAAAELASGGFLPERGQA